MNGIALTVEHVATYKTDNSHQRWAASALRFVAMQTTGLDVAEADRLREEYCDLAPKAKTDTSVKAKGAIASATESLDFAKAGVFPPLLMAWQEAAQHVAKLKMLGAIAADTRLAIDGPGLRARFADKYKALL
jgi:hypothetical protein